ncbi:MAG: VWA domain-containing protein [Treponema sp.]|jgi:Ca-activated chloride channel family protein|nr:VWA domain-containing protein [Treponema sp.]
MTFDHPFVLSAYIIFIPLILFDFLGKKRRYSYELPDELKRKLKLSVLLFRVFIACIIIALAGPRWGTGFTASEYRRGLDVVFAVDVSRSMDIRDAHLAQSRLERGLSVAGESAAAVSGARIAVAIGRSKGYLAIPLTWDNESALTFLETLDGSSMTGRSTNLESLLDAAAGAFQASSPARKVIVLVSDGESLSGVLKNAIDKCAKDGILINTLAVGSDEGRSVEAKDTSEIRAAVSRRESSVMRMATVRTGGIYIDGGRADAVAVLSGNLLSFARETNAAGGRSEPRQRRSLFVILAIMAFGASKFVPLTRSKPHASLIIMVLIFSPLLQNCSQGKLYLMQANYLSSHGRYDEAIASYHKAGNYEDTAPYAEYGTGLTFYLLDENKAALKRYADSQKMLGTSLSGEHRELRYRINYNSGIIYFSEGDFRSAAEAFKNALREDPRRMEAKHNLELSLMSIERETEENKTEQGNNQTREILFDFIRRKEENQWKSREWNAEDEPAGLDY